MRFPVNTDILRAKSDVFKVMFQDRLPDDNEIWFGDISANVFKAFLCLFNNKPFAMDFDVIVEAMHLSKEYNVGDNFKFVTNLITFVPRDDVINAFALAVKYNFPLNSWKELIETRVLNSKKWLFLLNADQVKRVVKLCNMKIDTAFLFDACIEWEQNQRNCRYNPTLLGDYHQLIEFGSMASWTFVEHAEKIAIALAPRYLEKLFICRAFRHPLPPIKTDVDEACSIGKTTSFKRVLDLASMEELRFSPNEMMLFHGIKIAQIFHHAPTTSKQFTVILAVVYVSSTHGNIDIWKESFTFEVESADLSSSKMTRELKFKEAIFLKPDLTIAVQIRFYACDDKYSHYMCRVGRQGRFFSILHDETNTKIITDLYCVKY